MRMQKKKNSNSLSENVNHVEEKRNFAGRTDILNWIYHEKFSDTSVI